MVGTVVTLRLDKGFGFVRSDGVDVFFHCRDLPPDLPFDEALEQRTVEYDVADTPRGERAKNMRAAV